MPNQMKSWGLGTRRVAKSVWSKIIWFLITQTLQNHWFYIFCWQYSTFLYFVYIFFIFFILFILLLSICKLFAESIVLVSQSIKNYKKCCTVSRKYKINGSGTSVWSKIIWFLTRTSQGWGAEEEDEELRTRNRSWWGGAEEEDEELRRKNCGRRIEEGDLGSWGGGSEKEEELRRRRIEINEHMN